MQKKGILAAIIALLVIMLSTLSINVLAEEISYPELSGYEKIKDIASITFEEGTTISAIRSKKSNAFDYDNGTGQLNVASTETEGYGNSAMFVASGTTQTQMSALWSRVSTGIVVYEAEFYFADFNKNRIIFTPNFAMASGSTGWGTGFGVAAGSDSANVSVGSAKKALELNKWYTFSIILNIDTKSATYYIDGEYFQTVAISQNAVKINRVNIQAPPPATGEAVMYMDNLNWSSYGKAPEILNATATAENIMVYVSDDVDVATLDSNNITVLFDGSSVELQAFDYSTEEKKITITPSTPMVTSMEYILRLSKAVTSAAGISFTKEEYLEKSLMSAPADFDVLSVAVKDGSVFGKLQNKTGEYQSAIMVAILVNESNEIVGFLHSPTTEVTDMECDIELKLPNNGESSIQVFFIDNWSSRICIKNYIYKSEVSKL